MDELAFLLPVEWHANEMVAETDAEKADAAALLQALAAASAVPPESSTATFVRSAAPERGYRAVAQSSGASFILMQPQRIFVRQNGPRLLMIERADLGGSIWLSELWRVP